MKQLAVGLGALALAACVYAQEASPAEDGRWVVGLHLASIHDIGGYENNNPGVYVRYHNWTTGVFQNSVNKTAVYAAYTFEWDTPKLPLVDSVAITAGLTSGYPHKIQGTDLSVLFVPSVAFKITQDTRLRVGYIPAFQEFNRATAVHLMVEMSF